MRRALTLVAVVVLLVAPVAEAGHQAASCSGGTEGADLMLTPMACVTELVCDAAGLPCSWNVMGSVSGIGVTGLTILYGDDPKGSCEPAPLGCDVSVGITLGGFEAGTLRCRAEGTAVLVEFACNAQPIAHP